MPCYSHLTETLLEIFNPERYILDSNDSHDPLHLSRPSRNKCNGFAKHLIQTSCLHQPLLCFVVSFFWILWYFTAVAGFPVQLVIRSLLLLQVFYVLSGFKWSVNIKLQFDTLHREIHSWHCFALLCIVVLWITLEYDTCSCVRRKDSV